MLCVELLVALCLLVSLAGELAASFGFVVLDAAAFEVLDASGFGDGFGARHGFVDVAGGVFLGLVGVEGGAGVPAPWAFGGAGFWFWVEGFGFYAEAIEGFEAGGDAVFFEAYPP